ncbi:glycosyltransferase family 4 protein [Puniceicoccaceae bacterium K14]|nr:glycosyltransferase family 4 protein [Puniceicoccaceae bacterium K14]
MVNQIKRANLVFDFTRMIPGGGNGGIKVHLFSFLEELIRFHQRYRISILCEESLISELGFLSSFHMDNQIHIIRPKGKVDIRSVADRLPIIKIWHDPPGNLLSQIGADLMYAGFGFSEFHDKTVPQIGLIPDCLHCDLPDHLPEGEVKARNFWFPVAIEQANLVQTNSDFCVSRLATCFSLPKEKALRMYLPLHERFAEINATKLPAFLDREPYFFYPANYWPHKNHELLLIAYQKYVHGTDDYPWKLVLSGDDSIENGPQSKELANALGISEHVHFLGHLPIEDLKQIWKYADAMVFPSLYEGFGLPTIEAMHFQTPMACSNVASLPEVAGDAAIYFDPRKPTEIADAFLKLSSDSDLRKSLQKACVARLPIFSLNREMDKVISAIDGLINAK